MSLMEDIKKRQQKARILRDPITSNVLTTLLGEAAMVGKNDGNRETTDEEALKVIVKFVKNIDETVSVLDPSDNRAILLYREREILSEFLPKMLTHDELVSILKEKFPEPAPIKDIMSFLKENYANQYDGKVASGIVKGLFA